MSIEAITQRIGGELVIPSAEADWEQWVSATATRNYLANNPLVDWLDLYGERFGFNRDTEFSTFDRRTDFNSFILKQGQAFEDAIARYLGGLIPTATISQGLGDVRALSKAEKTFEAMKDGQELIHQGVLWDAETRTYGAPDFLIRSDVLTRFLPDSLREEEAQQSAPDLGEPPWHYVVIDIKFTTLSLLSSGELGNRGSSPAYKAQLFIYNRALGRLQGYLPPRAFLMGRSWQQSQRGSTIRGRSCVEKLGPVALAGKINGRPLAEWVDSATVWIRRLRSEGADWAVLPRPSVPELWPNMADVSDFPWHLAKTKIASERSDLTTLWQVGVEKRAQAHEAGIYRWRDPRCTATALGITGAKVAPMLQAIIEVNQATDAEVVRPMHVSAAENEWRSTPPLEFYVDFETVNDLADDFSTIPVRGGQSLIFMIGCGHVEGGSWTFKCFIAEDLTESSEAEIIDNWLRHMDQVNQGLGLEGCEPRVIHWSRAETSVLESNYNAAKVRHLEGNWPTPNWFDFLNRVVKEEPVVIRGAFSFGLKAVAKAFYQQRLIQTNWDEGPADGLGAMVGAWWCAQEAEQSGVPMPEVPLMQGIAKYNEIDCRVMMEIVRYLRNHH